MNMRLIVTSIKIKKKSQRNRFDDSSPREIKYIYLKNFRKFNNVLPIYNVQPDM